MRNRNWLGLALALCASTAAHAQWLNYRDPGTPRLRDGKVNLAAPAPKTADGKPDLSGVWMHEVTGAAEMKRLYGKVAEEAEKTNVPGMELDTIHKYAFNILVDHPPEEGLMRPETAERMRLGGAPLDPEQACKPRAVAAPAFPLMGLLSEAIKIVQAP